MIARTVRRVGSIWMLGCARPKVLTRLIHGLQASVSSQAGNSSGKDRGTNKYGTIEYREPVTRVL